MTFPTTDDVNAAATGLGLTLPTNKQRLQIVAMLMTLRQQDAYVALADASRQAAIAQAYYYTNQTLKMAGIQPPLPPELARFAPLPPSQQPPPHTASPPPPPAASPPPPPTSPPARPPG